MSNPPASPFFAPSTPSHVVLVTQTTPGGTRRSLPVVTKDDVSETKSTLFGCTANLMNAIVGAGIVGIPYALSQAGFWAGIFLIILCAILTDTSLRLLIATAKHAHVPTYETLAEAAFGRLGFRFIALNMFINSYGAMLSYLMIVKDSFSAVLNINVNDTARKRAVLIIISLLIMVPLSSQRDMADLAKTSRLSVFIDAILVALVVYNAFISEHAPSHHEESTVDYFTEIVHPQTVFVGLGVLSFAYVCQHSAFIIAGSLDRPTVSRWSTVTRSALTLCAILALICGVSGYLGYGHHVRGNILLNLQATSPSANIARLLLGTTMLFVYPLESFVARHVCVVLFFQGRRAHDGEDSAVLNRRDRRILLTLVLYIAAVLPAAVFENMGIVLAITGTVGASCLSYIGPGAVFLGIHGERFLELTKQSWLGKSMLPQGPAQQRLDKLSTATETSSLIAAPSTTSMDQEAPNQDPQNKKQSEQPIAAATIPESLVYVLKWIIWHCLGMPIWCAIARQGQTGLTLHASDMASKSPHPIRIGDVQYSRMSIRKLQPALAKRVLASSSLLLTPEKRRAELGDLVSLDLRKDYSSTNDVNNTDNFDDFDTDDDTNYDRLHSGSVLFSNSNPSSALTTPTRTIAPLNLNQQIGQRLLLQQQAATKLKLKKTHQPSDSDLVVEADPQAEPPSRQDFAIAIFLILFGVLAFSAGIVSLFM